MKHWLEQSREQMVIPRDNSLRSCSLSSGRKIWLRSPGSCRLLYILNPVTGYDSNQEHAIQHSGKSCNRHRPEIQAKPEVFLANAKAARDARTIVYGRNKTGLCVAPPQGRYAQPDNEGSSGVPNIPRGSLRSDRGGKSCSDAVDTARAQA
jgi:hypothetical protein